MDTLMFAVFEVGATWPTYAQALAAANGYEQALDSAHNEDWTYTIQYLGGQQTPNQTKACVAFLDPSDRSFAQVPEGCSFLTEDQWFLDTGWVPGPSLAVSVNGWPDGWEKTVLGKKIAKLMKKPGKK